LDWEALDRLYEKDFISNPRSKAKSVMLTEESHRVAEELFEKHFGLKETAGTASK